MPKTLEELDKHASKLRSDLAVPKQNEVFANAVEAGYLAALADGKVDDEERTTIVNAILALSKESVLEWETDTLLDQCAAAAQTEGLEKRCRIVGQTLANLGAPEAGLLFAAFVAHATGGVDAKEKEVLKAVGTAAGLKGKKIDDLIAKAKS